MAKPILMPQVGQDIESGFINEWLVNEGDHVNKGDIIAVVESEKAAFDLEAFDSGVILKLLYEVGEEVKVLQPIAYIGEEGEVLEAPEEAKHAEKGIAKKPSKKVEEKQPTIPAVDSKILASPAARRVAREHGIELQQIPGSGPSGRIIKKDVIAKIQQTEPEVKPEVAEPEIETITPAAADKEIPFSRMRQKIAQRLLRSKQTIPHFYLFLDVDMTAALAWRTAYNQTASIRISINDIIVKATVFAIKKFPKMNAHVIENKLVQRKNINIGVAVSVEDGLLVPVIPDADQKNIQQISQISKKNIEGANRGVLPVTGIGTFTISNLGMHSIDLVLPIINPPECAILGVGKIEKRVVPLDNHSIGIRDYMRLGLACDHRAVDGTYASQFLNAIKHHLENFTL